MLTPQQELGYEVQSAEHGKQPETFATYFARLAKRVRFYRFFFLAPLYLALPAAPFLLAERKYRFVLAIILIFALGTNFYPYFYSHYIAAIACLMILLFVAALERLDRWTIRGYSAGRDAARVILFLCFAHFAFWYGLHAAGRQDFARDMWRFESWDAINSGDPNGRIAIHNELSAMPGKQLVFVQYSAQYSSTNGFTTRPISTIRKSYGRAIWAGRKTKSCCSIILVANLGCFIPTLGRCA